MSDKPNFNVRVLSNGSVYIRLPARFMPNVFWRGIGTLLIILLFAAGFGTFMHPVVGIIIFLLFTSAILPEMGWTVSGYEVLALDQSFLVYKFGLLGVRIRRHRFRVDRISNVRLAAQVNNDQWRIGLWSARPKFFRKNSIGMIVFDIGPVPFAFGTSLSPAEAKVISAELTTQLKIAQKP